MLQNEQPRSTRRTRRAGRKYQQRKRRALLIQLLNEEGIQVPGLNAPRRIPIEEQVFDSRLIIQDSPTSPLIEEQVFDSRLIIQDSPTSPASCEEQTEAN